MDFRGSKRRATVATIMQSSQGIRSTDCLCKNTVISYTQCHHPDLVPASRHERIKVSGPPPIASEIRAGPNQNTRSMSVSFSSSLASRKHDIPTRPCPYLHSDGSIIIRSFRFCPPCSVPSAVLDRTWYLVRAAFRPAPRFDILCENKD